MMSAISFIDNKRRGIGLLRKFKTRSSKTSRRKVPLLAGLHEWTTKKNSWAEAEAKKMLEAGGNDANKSQVVSDGKIVKFSFLVWSECVANNILQSFT